MSLDRVAWIGLLMDSCEVITRSTTKEMGIIFKTAFLSEEKRKKKVQPHEKNRGFVPMSDKKYEEKTIESISKICLFICMINGAHLFIE